MNEQDGRTYTDPGGYTGEGVRREPSAVEALRNEIAMADNAGAGREVLEPMLRRLAKAEAEEAQREEDQAFAAIIERTKEGTPLTDTEREMFGMEREFDRLLDFHGPREPRAWLFQDWLPALRVALLTGTGGFGKSTLALTLAVAVADHNFKHPFGGFPQAQTNGPVVFATYEDELEEFARRIQKACHTGGMQEGMNQIGVSPDRLHILDLTPHGALWAPHEHGGQHIANRAELTPTGDRLRRYCETLGACWLIVDPLASAYLSDENNRGLVRAFMSDWDAWSKASGCGVLFIAHPPKSKNAYSGSTDWHAAARAVLMLEYPEDEGGKGKKDEADEKPQLQLQHIKSSYAAKQEPVPLVWKEGTLTGEYGNDPNDF